MKDERIYSIALTLCPGIGHVRAKRLITELGSASQVFERRGELERIFGLNPRLAEQLDNPALIERAEREVEYMESHRVNCLTLSDDNYPLRLRECEDGPAVLFYRGEVNFNARHIISIVGTRKCTDYGKLFCQTFVRDLARYIPDLVVVSGLAYGIDVHAHRAALDNGLDTIGVVAHGQDTIYPNAHKRIANEITEHGAVLTEFISGTEIDNFNFVQRNRIVAGISDATIVVESAKKGGSLITAELAVGYHRECFAVPGKVTDKYSEGCNKLIRDNSAGLICNAEDFLNAVCWLPQKVEKNIQRTIFPELTEQEEQVVKLLQQKGDLHLNNIVVETGIPIFKISSILFELEMKGVVKPLVGGMYHLLS